MIFFSLDDSCLKITRDAVTEVTILLHANHALLENHDQNVFIRSPSGDVDVNILCLAIFPLHADRIWIDYVAGDHRHILRLNSIDMDEEKKLALLGFHETTGNDYVSSFFRRGKEKSWKILEKFSRFMTMFASLGDTCDLSEEHLELLEEFVCHLYGGKVTRLMHLGTKSIKTFIVLRTKYKTYLYFHLVGDL